ncbi:MAG: hypothetical protein ACTHMS_15865 [Jatrophihabitans sp.]|uniref:hypothetical protein n=1 Tax=Jatrophihabitans sp. TaxID=1932789 RepID=UPI003F814543
MTGADLAPGAFRLALPAGWVRLDVRGDLDATVREAVESVRPPDLPRDEWAPRRAKLEGLLRTAAAGAASIDALGLYLPLGGMHGMSIPASFVVAEATQLAGGSVQEVLTALAAAPGAALASVDGEPSVRTDEVVTPARPSGGVEVPPTRRVAYVFPAPHSSRWLTVTCSVLAVEEAAAPVVGALVTLFDAVMTTFRWV